MKPFWIRYTPSTVYPYGYPKEQTARVSLGENEHQAIVNLASAIGSIIVYDVLPATVEDYENQLEKEIQEERHRKRLLEFEIAAREGYERFRKKHGISANTEERAPYHVEPKKPEPLWKRIRRHLSA